MMPDAGATFAILSASYNAIQNVKLYRKQCEDLRGRCLTLLNAIQDSSTGLEGAPILGITDELSMVIERIQTKIIEWSTWSHLKCVVQQGDMKDGLNRLNRELDGCMMKFNVQANIETHRSHIDLKSNQERDNSNIRELLLAIVKSQDDMRQLLNTQSSPVVEGVMENLQTQLMAPGLQPVEEKDFKAGLWQLHERTSRLPPLTDLSGQITLLPSSPIAGSSNDIYQGQWLDKQKVALRSPRALDDSPATRKRFEIEVSFWRQLEHPNVIPLYGIVNIRKLYSVTPWMDNGNASTYVARFPSVDRLRLLYETACGLVYLHEKKIVHGDLRAHNILVSDDGVACLSDFGLSKFFEDCDKKLVPYNNASLRWTAPEVLRYDGSISTHSDVWAFGMVCLEILSGRFPFYGKDDKGVQRQLEHEKHPDRPHLISDEMWNLMLKCWSKIPEARPSMSAVKKSLEEIKSHSLVDRIVDETASFQLESPSRKHTLKKITTFFGRKSDEDKSRASPITSKSFGRKIDDDKGRASITSKPSTSSFLPTTPPRGQESFGRVTGHDWRVMDRASSSHSYTSMSSMVNSPSSSYATTLPMVNNSQISPNQPGFSPSKRGSVNNLWDESQKGLATTSKAKAPNHSRFSSGPNSSFRHWQSPDLYEIPDEDVHLERRDILADLGHQHTSHDYASSISGQFFASAAGASSRPSTMSSLELPSRDTHSRHRNADYDLNVGSSPNSSTGGASWPSSSSLEAPSFDVLANFRNRSTNSDHPNSMSDRNSSTGGTSRPSTAPSMMEMSPSRSNSSNTTSAELPSLGMPFLSSSPPRILGGNFRQSPMMLSVHLRSSTMGSSQSMEPNLQIAVETRDCILNATSGHVSSGTLEGLVQYLIDGFDSPRHTEYRDVFLMACAEFTTPDGLFQILSRRFVDEEKNQNAERRVVTQYNILMIISYWLKGAYLTPSQELFYRMKFFCEELSKFKSAGTLLDRATDLHHAVTFEIEKLRGPPPRTSVDLGGTVLQSSQVTPRDLAIGLTLLEGDNYGALHPSDYIIQLTKHKSAKIKKMYDTNNKIKTWVTGSILHFEDVHDRAEVLKFFIHAAVECQTMRNFSSATAIASALHSSAVDNLRITRKALTRNMQGKLSDLYDIINPESNHRGYRDILHSPNVQENDICIPWMAFHLKELGRVLRVYPVTVEEDGQQLINFDRYIKFMERTREIMYYTPPDLDEWRLRGQLAYLLNQLRDIDLSDESDERLMSKSRSLMLQEASDYRTRKPQLVKLGFDFY